MISTKHRLGRLWVAPVLIAILAITTGWAPPAARVTDTPNVSAGHVADDFARSSAESIYSRGPQGRVARPQRAIPAIATGVPSVAKPAVPSSSVTNHFWMPALGINRQVYSFPCARRRAPDNLLYRWGCAGRNNVYILGHAYGVMKPLHDAYVAGRLRVGMLATYADADGNLRTYRVTTWRLVRPTNGAWAEASQSVPSMTLQTCVGALSQWRLVVRLVATD